MVETRNRTGMEPFHYSMKISCFIWLFFSYAVCDATSDSLGTEKIKPTRIYRVFVDVGHGGKDLGAKGLFGIYEKDLCLQIGQMIQRELERSRKIDEVPVEARLSRMDDSYMTLSERVRMANEWNADFFISIHANTSDEIKARGFEVYFLNAEATDAAARHLARAENQDVLVASIAPDVRSILSDVRATQHVTESGAFAEKMFSAMSLTLRPNIRGVRQAPFTVLFGTTMPAVLVEVGYLSNPIEAFNLKRGPYLKKVASAITSGIVDFIANLKK